ncbi:c-type cytochrome [Burkholderia stabilis]|uniref:c-type cytochrome n=1 Tax=Burkholderia stabilis TaxID=95485 RepID=UPI001F4A4D04|nr:c-type cytochrome [Burkholderia stabilis]
MNRLSVFFAAAAASLVALHGTAMAEPGCAPEAGRHVFATKCAMCHAADKSQGTIVGPNLFGVFERPVGKLPGFTYSPALAASDGTWDAKALDLFLKAPAVAKPGTSMPFAGIRNDADRASTICYLKALR